MPLHDFRCPAGHISENVVSAGTEELVCPFCGGMAKKVFLKAPLGFVQGNICYDSPIDGRPVTTKWQREDDLRRNGCVPWEPGMRQDAERFRRESEAALDRSVDESIEREIAAMPSRKVERLASELEAGADVAVVRS